MDYYWVGMGIILISLSVLLVIASFKVIQAGNVGAVFLLGAFSRRLTPGPHLILFPLEKVEIYPTSTKQDELPDEPENIDRVGEVAAPGKKLPYRVNHKGLREAIFYVPKGYSKDTPEWKDKDPFDNSGDVSLSQMDKVHFNDLPEKTQKALEEDSLHAALTGEWSIVFEWYLKGDDEIAIQHFVETISPEAGRDRVQEVRKRAEDLAASVLRTYLAPTTLGHADFMARAFDKVIKEELEKLVGEDGKDSGGDRSWGIQIGNAYAKSPYPGHRVNIARADAAKAVSEKRQGITKAEELAEATKIKTSADALNLVTSAKARKKEKILDSEAEAKRVENISSAVMKPGGKFVMANETAQKVLPNARVIMTPEKGGAMASILALGETIKEESEAKETPA